MSCNTCSLPESLCVCKASRPALQLPSEEIETPPEAEARAAKAFKESLDLQHFRRFAGLSESERKGDLVSLAQQISGHGAALLKATNSDMKAAALKALMLMAVSMKKMALVYAMEPVVDAAEKLADELDKASRSS